VVRPVRSLVFVVLLLAGLLACAFVTGCKHKSDATTEAAADVPVVNDKTEGLQLTWIDEKGEFHIEQRVADVPEAGRQAVRVRLLDPSKDVPTDDRLFLADLRQPGPDGNYPVRSAPRAEFENLAVTRRSKSGTATLEPKAAASVASAPSAGKSAGSNGSDLVDRPAVIIYGASWCGPCHQAAAYLKKRGVEFVEHDIEQDSSAAHEMHAKLAKAGMRGGSIPVLDVRGKIMVGFDQRAVDQALGQAM
jgi:glutaredoxin